MWLFGTWTLGQEVDGLDDPLQKVTIGKKGTSDASTQTDFVRPKLEDDLLACLTPTMETPGLAVLDEAAAEMEHVKPFEGTFVDSSRSFFQGRLIKITEESWTPLGATFTSTFVLKHISDTEKELQEKRIGGDKKRYKVVEGKMPNTLFVTYVAKGSETRHTWTLARHETKGKFAVYDMMSHRGQKKKLEFRCTWEAWKKNCMILNSNDWFDSCIAFLIVLNSAMLGVEIEYNIQGTTSVFIQVTEFFFLFVYIVEIGMRITGLGWGFIKEWHVIFDLAVLVAGLVTALLPFFAPRYLSFVRILRLLRLLRVVRRAMQPLWRLIDGIFKALPTLVSAFLVLAASLYAFSAVAAPLIAINEDLINERLSEDMQNDIRTILEKNFSSFPAIFLTFVQFTTKDIKDIFFPLCMTRPYTAVFMLFSLALISVHIMNLITAVLVEGAIARGQEDMALKHIKMKRKVAKYVPVLKHIFSMLDKEGMGEIFIDDLFAMNLESEEFTVLNLPDQIMDCLSPESILESVECFDADNSGSISEEEFVETCMAVLVADARPETVRALQLVRVNAKIMKEVDARINFLESIMPEEFDDGAKPMSPKSRSGTALRTKTNELGEVSPALRHMLSRGSALTAPRKSRVGGRGLRTLSMDQPWGQTRSLRTNSDFHQRSLRTDSDYNQRSIRTMSNFSETPPRNIRNPTNIRCQTTNSVASEHVRMTPNVKGLHTPTITTDDAYMFADGKLRSPTAMSGIDEQKNSTRSMSHGMSMDSIGGDVGGDTPRGPNAMQMPALVAD